jgi:hypothetical protein
MMKSNKRTLLWMALLLIGSTTNLTEAHDTWVQVNSPQQQVGELVFVELCLGNHANDHRDYRLASRLSSLEHCDVVVRDQNGPLHKLTRAMTGFGTAANEGPWIGSWIPDRVGLFHFESQLDIIKGTARARQISRTYFGVGDTSGQAYIPPSSDFMIDLVPLSDPLSATAGTELVFRVQFAGKPQPQARVSFLPLGVTLAEGFDPEYERWSDDDGIVRFTPSKANRYLVITKRIDEVEEVNGINRLAFSASCSLYVGSAAKTTSGTEQHESADRGTVGK